MLCFVLTFTVFYVVLWARSAVLLYSLGSNLLFLCVVREEKDGGTAMPDPQPVSTNSKSCLP